MLRVFGLTIVIFFVYSTYAHEFHSSEIEAQSRVHLRTARLAELNVDSYCFQVQQVSLEQIKTVPDYQTCIFSLIQYQPQLEQAMHFCEHPEASTSTCKRIHQVFNIVNRLLVKGLGIQPKEL